MLLHDIRLKNKSKSKEFKYLNDDKELKLLEEMYSKTLFENFWFIALIFLGIYWLELGFDTAEVIGLVIFFISVVKVLIKYLNSLIDRKECNISKWYINWIFIKRAYKLFILYLYYSSIIIYVEPTNVYNYTVMGLNYSELFYLASILTICGLTIALITNNLRSKMVEISLSNIANGLKRGQLDIAKESLKSEEDMRMLWGEGYYVVYKQIWILIDKVEKLSLEEEVSLIDRTELITNASHDIRTPLTSIINYIDILKNKEISNDEREEFIQIIENKLKRLKVLVEDLKYATNFSIGEAECNLNEYDVKELLNSSLEQNKDSLNGLDILKEFEDVEYKCYIDKNNTLRVFDNLISNISKYSLEGSRVYVCLCKDNKGEIKIVFKNISKSKLNIPPEELMKRFKRGDLSRNTKGHGLGLDISKNLIHLQKGEFKIEIEGDLFKVEINIPKKGWQ